METTIKYRVFVNGMYQYRVDPDGKVEVYLPRCRKWTTETVMTVALLEDLAIELKRNPQ